MRWPGRRSREPVVGVVVPAYDVAAFLPACLDSLLAQTHRALEVVVVDDGSPDASGRIADQYAARDNRVHVVHSVNVGLGAARNLGVRHLGGDLLTFLDSDDVLPLDAYERMVGHLAETGSDFVAASFVRWERGGDTEPAWMRRLHRPARFGITAEEHPEILGDVFAWDKMFRRSFWDGADLSWPEGVRYEDQPCTTEAFLRGRFDVVPEVVYRWRIRDDGTSITQQRGSLRDLRDRFETKRRSLATVRALGSPETQRVFVDRVMAGDMWRYFDEIPVAGEEWWALLRSGIADLWGDRSLTHSGLRPVHRLVAWLVEQNRRQDAAAVVRYAARRPVARVTDAHGVRRIHLPLLDETWVDPAATALRPHET